MFIDPLPYISKWAEQSQAHPTTEKRGPALEIVTPIFVSAAVFCVAVRLYSRIVIRRWVGIDDLLILLALLSSLSVTACLAVAVRRHKWDHHVWALSADDYAPSVKLFYFMDIFWGIASSCVRLSVLCLFYRLAKSCHAPRLYFWILHATLVFNLALMFFYIFNGIFPCRPIRAFWAWPAIEGATCQDEAKIIQAIAIVNTISEFFLATLPLLGVFELGVRKGQRWSVVCLLSLGYLVGLTGCVRTYFVCTLFTGDFDVTWWVYPQYICSEVEIDLAIICACAAPLRPFARRVYRILRKPGPSIGWSTKGSKITQKGESTVRSRDFEWQSTIQQVIDIEGISSDSYAYTVVISGPTPQKKSMLMRLGLRKRNNRLSQISTAVSGNAGPNISHRTEVIIESACPRYGLPGSCNSKYDPSEGDNIHMYAASDVVNNGLRSRGGGGVDAIKEFEQEQLEARQTFFDDTRSAESVEALPAMPAPVSQTSRSQTRRFSFVVQLPQSWRPSIDREGIDARRKALLGMLKIGDR
jgi:hypothetical protein